jgi:HK97 family phage major capsid protein
MSKLKALLEKKASLQQEARAMSENITKETRAMTEEEQTKWAELRAELDSVTNTIDALQEMRDLDDAEEQEDGDAPARTDEQVEESENRAFANFVRAIISKEDRADANLTFSANSNAVVPKTIAKKIVARIYDISPVVERATKYVTKGTLEIPVYGANAGTDITIAYATEFTDLESKVGKFTSIELQGYLAGALVKLSNSLINNTDLDLVNFVIERMAYEVGRFMEGELLNGTDTKIAGITTLEAGQLVETATAGVVDGDDLISVKNKVKQAFRKRAIWVMSTETKSSIEKLKDENGRYLFTEDLTGEFDGKILGYPVYVSDAMVEAEEGNTAVYFGDFAGLALKWNEQLEIQVLREKYATQHATGIVAWIEADSNVENNQMLAGLTVK